MESADRPEGAGAVRRRVLPQRADLFRPAHQDPRSWQHGRTDARRRIPVSGRRRDRSGHFRQVQADPQPARHLRHLQGFGNPGAPGLRPQDLSPGQVRVAVVTPYYREPDPVLVRCLDGVARQTHPCTHFMIADGHPNPLADAYPQAIHLKLPQAHGDNGDTPRGFGAAKALEAGFDGIAFLDADNWFRPRHIESLVELQAKTEASVVVARRSFHRLDGSEIIGLAEAGDAIHFADTSCLLLC
ncbi:MAG: glycosyltransferase, partial [Rhodospirillales bacterium]